MSIMDALPERLLTKHGEVDASELEMEFDGSGKQLLCIYFSAHWCPPCRGFTPQLATCYNNGLSKGAEVLFVSSDQDQASFDEYYSQMPWLAVPFHEREVKNALSREFDVRGIPTLVVINAETEEVVTTSGRADIDVNNPAATLAKWGYSASAVQAALDQDIQRVASMTKTTVEVGPIWNNTHAQQLIQQYAAANPSHQCTGGWWTTVPGSMSVIEVMMPAGARSNLSFMSQPSNYSGG